MQALTVAIGPSGITYFTGKLVTNELLKAVSGLKLLDRTISVPDFSAPPPGTAKWWDIQIVLSSAKLNNFNPGYQGPTQQPQGHFQIVFAASNFSAYYSWHEAGQWEYWSRTGMHGPYSFDNRFDYTPGVGKLTVTVTLGFVYNASVPSYDIDLLSSNSETSNVSPNIPGQSILQNQQSAGLFSSTVSDATAQAVDNIDFRQLISELIPSSLLRSIPASGQLTPDIRYEFGLGDSGLSYPNDQGIAIGITGRVSYKGQYYPGTPPAALPLPPAPTDTHHLQVYVSDYEVNALHWAFFQAGLLNVTVKADDLPDPDVLKVKTYVSQISAFKPYAAYSMQAQVKPKQTPMVAFQEVYVFTKDAMSQLQSQLPTDVYQQISGLRGNAYVSVADLEADLAGTTVPQTDYPTIEKATKVMGMAVTQDWSSRSQLKTGRIPCPIWSSTWLGRTFSRIWAWGSTAVPRPSSMASCMRRTRSLQPSCPRPYRNSTRRISATSSGQR